MMTKSLTKTTKKKNISNRNSQNVTVGTLADAQQQDGDKNNGGESNGSSSSSNNGIGIGKGSKGSGENKNQKGRYMYCDFAQIEEEEYDVDYEIDQEGLLQALDEATTMAAAQTVQHQTISYLQQPPPVLRASGWVRSQRFPTKLYALLSQPQLSHIIAWMPHGRSWKVLKPRVFETSVLPVFFESDNYHSFNRVINAWSFRRKSTGPDRGSYFHELFLRGKPHLQKYMRRLPRTHKKLTMSKSEEPDFFELENTSPLPSLEEARVNLESRKLLRLREHYEKESIVQHDNDHNNNDNGTVHEQIVQSVQTKQRQEYLKHVDAWHNEGGGGASRQQDSKDMGTSIHANEYNGHGIQGIHRTTKNFQVPGMLFQMQQNDNDVKLEEPRHLRNTLVGGGKSSQANAVRRIEAEAVMMRQIEQEQYLRARGMRQQLALHQHQQQQQQQQQSHMIRQADLLRQMDILQASSSQAQQNGY